MLLPRSWQALLQQGYILVGGRNFRLDHLLGHTVQFTIRPAVTYPALLVDMHIEYSSHCVSVCATKEGARGEYEVFFQLKKGDVAKTLRLVIESAYVRDPAGTGRGIPRNRRGTIRFSVMAAKRLRGERIRHPGHNR